MALALSSEFDYFAPQVIAGDIEEEYDVAIGTKQAITGKGPLEFSIPAETNVYRDLNNSLLEVTCKVEQATGTALAGGTAIAPVNLLLHALFRSCEVSLNGKRVSDANNYYAERAYVETLLNCPEDVLKTRGVCEGWAKDDAAAMNGITLTGDGTNTAFVKRNGWCAGSKVMKLVGRLHADLFHQPLDIPSNVKIDIKLDQNPDAKILMAAATVTHKVTIQSARLLVRSKRLASDLVLAHQKFLASRNYRFPYTKVLVKNDTLAAGLSEISRNNFHEGPTPSRVTIFMAKSASVNGAYNANPFAFENFGVTSLYLKVGKDKFPSEDITMDHTNGVIYPAYLSTLASLGFDQGIRTLSITPEDWSRSFNIYSFKLTPGPVSANVLHPTQANTVRLELHAKFAAALADPITIFAYIEEPSLLEIDSLDNVISA